MTISENISSDVFGNVINVAISSGGARATKQTISGNITGAPLGADIINHFTGSKFVAGTLVVALEDDNNSSIALFGFSLLNGTITLTFQQEVHSDYDTLNIDVDSGPDYLTNLTINAASGNPANYQVRVLPLVNSASMSGGY